MIHIFILNISKYFILAFFFFFTYQCEIVISIWTCGKTFKVNKRGRQWLNERRRQWLTTCGDWSNTSLWTFDVTTAFVWTLMNVFIFHICIINYRHLVMVQISEHSSLYPETYLVLALCSDKILKFSCTVLQNIQQSGEHNRKK